MTEFWDNAFREMQTMWGFEPSDSAIAAKEFLLKQPGRDLLIPGMGYGRNAKIFIESGFRVTGIEISQTAIQLARNETGIDGTIYHGSVLDMPFDKRKYDAVFCYALVHLFNVHERSAFIRNCYQQLKPGGHMIFSFVSTMTSMFGDGQYVSRNRYRMPNGLKVYFYDMDAAEREFGRYGLVEVRQIDEPIKHMDHEQPMKFIYLVCRKAS